MSVIILCRVFDESALIKPFVVDWVQSELVGALGPVNHKVPYQSWKPMSIHLLLTPHKRHKPERKKIGAKAATN